MWNTISANKIIHEKDKWIIHEKHLFNLENVKSQIKITQPFQPSFLKKRAKQKISKELQKNKIAHENDILVDKMLYIEKGKTSLNKEILFQTYRKINFYNVNNKRIKGLQRINTENKFVARRLQNIEAYYDFKKFEEEISQKKSLLERFNKNSVRFKYSDFPVFSGTVNKLNEEKDEIRKQSLQINKEAKTQKSENIKKRPFSAPRKILS